MIYSEFFKEYLGVEGHEQKYGERTLAVTYNDTTNVITFTVEGEAIKVQGCEFLRAIRKVTDSGYNNPIPEPPRYIGEEIVGGRSHDVQG